MQQVVSQRGMERAREAGTGCGWSGTGTSLSTLGKKMTKWSSCVSST